MKEDKSVSDERFLNLLNSLPNIAVQGFTGEGIIRNWNEASEQIYGYTAREALGKNLIDLIIPPEMRAEVARSIRRMAETGEPIPSAELLLLRKDGSRVSVYSSHARVQKPEGGIELFCMDIDISDRREAEEKLRESEARFRSYFNMPLHGFAISSAEKEMMYINQRLCSILGYTTEEIVHKTWAEMTHPDDLAGDLDLYNSLLAGEIEQYDMEKRYIRKDGKAIWARIAVGCVRKIDGTIDYIVAMIEDINERKLMEQEKEKLQAQLLQSRKMESVGRLAGGVAHDFNNMLSAIIGHSELAMERLEPGHAVFENIVEINKAAQRSAELTGQLLAFARKQAVNLRVMDLNAKIDGMLKMLSRLMGENISLKWQPCEIICPVKMDSSQIDQILTNLCVNAVYAINGVGNLIIRTEICCPEKIPDSKSWNLDSEKFVLLSVIDDGCGMDEETMENLFEPFFTTKEVGRGTGLGLSTVYGIIRQNNGFIEVESSPGKGSAFRIYFPLNSGTVEPAEKPRDEKIRKGNETILLVEDDPAILEMIKKILESLEYSVLTASTPNEALGIAKEYGRKIHLLITDVIMPGKNGHDLAVELSAEHPGLKILFMSGYTADILLNQGLPDREINFIQKPFSINSFSARVRSVMDQD